MGGMCLNNLNTHLILMQTLRESPLKFTLLSEEVREFCSDPDKALFDSKSAEFRTVLQTLLDNDDPKEKSLTSFARLLLGNETEEIDRLEIVVPIIPLPEVTFDQHAVYLTAIRLMASGAKICFIFLERFAEYVLEESYIQRGGGGTGMSQKHKDYIEGMLKKEFEDLSEDYSGLKEKMHFYSENELTEKYASSVSFDKEWIKHRFPLEPVKKMNKDFRFGLKGSEDCSIYSNMLLRSFLLVKEHMTKLDGSEQDKCTVLLIPSIRHYIAAQLEIPEAQILQTWYFDTYLLYSDWFLDYADRKKNPPARLYSIQGWGELDSDSLDWYAKNKMEFVWLLKNHPLCLKQMGFLSEAEIFENENDVVGRLNVIREQAKSLVKDNENFPTKNFDLFAQLFGNEFTKKKTAGEVQWSTIMLVYFRMLLFIREENSRKGQNDFVDVKIQCGDLTPDKMEGIPTALKTLQNRVSVIDTLKELGLININSRKNGVPETIEVVLFNVNIRQ
jgi:hypothetical protein